MASAKVDDAIEASNVGQSLDPAFLLRSLAKTPCLYRMESYWTYEFCFGKSVRQFHAEVQEYYLGYWDKKQSSLEPQMDDVYSQNYVGGTPCELANQKRSVEVRYLCNPKPNGITYVGQLSEPSTCRYTLLVYTPLVCPAGGAKAAVTAPPTIYCNPSLDSPTLAQERHLGSEEEEQVEKHVPKSETRSNAKMTQRLELVGDNNVKDEL